MLTISCDPLSTERLLLEPFSEKFLTEKYVFWLNDPKVVRYSGQRLMTHSLSSCMDFWQRIANSGNAGWAIVLRAPESEGTHIGNITTDFDTLNGVTDIRMLIGETCHWGKGYGLEAFNAVIEYLFNSTDVRKITAGTLSLNLGMQAIMKRAGMKPDGVRIKHCVIEEDAVDVVYGAIFREDVSV